MILTKFLKIKFNSSNKKHFQSLNYHFENNKKVEIPVEHLNLGSNYEIHVKCEICGKEKMLSYKKYIKNTKNFTKYYSCSSKCSKFKKEETNLKRFNSKYFFSSEIGKKKIHKIIKDKYNVENISKDLSVKDKKLKSREKSDFLKYKEFYFKENLNLLKCDKKNKIYTFECEKCEEFEISLNLLKNRRNSKTVICTNCNPINKNVSGMELDFVSYLKEIYNGEIIENDRNLINPYELDVVLPEIKLAFEFNGLFWHDNSQKDDDYHIMKSNFCEKKGFKLIHIWEDDWLEGVKIKNMINKLLDKNKKRSIKDCTVKLIDNIEADIFFKDNHYKYTPSKINNAVYYNNELIFVLAIESSIVQCCTKIGYKIIDLDIILNDYKNLKATLVRNYYEEFIDYFKIEKIEKSYWLVENKKRIIPDNHSKNLNRIYSSGITHYSFK